MKRRLRAGVPLEMVLSLENSYERRRLSNVAFQTKQVEQTATLFTNGGSICFQSVGVSCRPRIRHFTRRRFVH
ncbi:hypothetical protein NDU88_000608 [Pleurodeles waltl]|uniref:Uncharacterized protein n=1 Tax=Pleurodeles waltl TaxID=8319 RepID=A0AAV7URK4_PLEWA|nr:hypothetical protein NDU88_000608 [Pleurodeles waltl]